MKSTNKGYRVIPTFFCNFGRTCPSLTPADQLLFPRGAGLCVTHIWKYRFYTSSDAHSPVVSWRDLCWKSDRFHLSCFTVQAEDIKWRWRNTCHMLIGSPWRLFYLWVKTLYLGVLFACVCTHWTILAWKIPPSHPRLRLISQGNRHARARAHYSGT